MNKVESWSVGPFVFVVLEVFYFKGTIFRDQVWLDRTEIADNN